MNITLMAERTRSKAFKVLLVDDEPGQRLLQKDILASDEFIISEANDGRTALREIGNNDFDVILLDKNMPDIQGDEVCKIIRTEMNDLLLPIIIVSGISHGEELTRSLEAGATDYIRKPYSPSELRARVTKAAKHKKFLEQLEHANSIYPAMLGIVEAKDGYSGRHCRRVAKNSVLFGEYLGLDAELICLLERLSTFHDIGKLAIPDHILQKKEVLTVRERKIMEMHSVIGAEFCGSIKTLSSLLPLIRHHHENWDGSGFPDGLAGEEIPFLVRVFQLLDSYDALADNRPYSKAFCHDEIIEYIKNDRIKFDPEIVELFVKFINKNMGGFNFPSKETEGKRDGNNAAYDLIQKEIDFFNKTLTVRKKYSLTSSQTNVSVEHERYERFSAVLETTTVGLFGLDIEGRVSFVNAAACSMLGHTKDELMGFIHHDIVHHSTADGHAYERNNCPIHHSLTTGESIDGEELFFHKSGAGVPIEFSCVPIFVGEKINGVVVTFQDVSGKINSDRELQLANTVFNNSHEAMLVTDANKNILKVNRAFTQVTGYYEQDVIGHPPGIFRSYGYSSEFYEDINKSLMEKGSWHGEVDNKTRSGEKFTALLNIKSVKNKLGHVTNYVGIFSDVTSIKKAREEIERMAHHDPLTGLPNRLLFNNRLKIAVNHARRGEYSLAILFIDLDRFKDINDSLGHSAGDQLLMEVANRVKLSIRKEDVVARLGGDEFVVLLERIETPNDAATIAKKLMKSIEEPMMIDNHALVLTMSIGISVFPRDADDTDKLVRSADAAMYHAKEFGFNGYQFFNKKMTQKVEEQMLLEVSLRKAIEKNEFELYYQPQVDLKTGALTGVEALIRWNHPILGVVSPLQFIHVAESTGLIVPIGGWVLHAACKQARLWLDQGVNFGHVSVNVSSVQIHRDGLLDIVKNSLRESRLEPRYLEIEITESAIMHQIDENMALLNELKELGVVLSIDDFGTGFSSLSYLQNLPIDKLKIDRSFVSNLPENKKDIAITKTIIALSKGLGLNVVAEGIETEVQHKCLEEQGCIEGQGWLYGKPMTASQFVDYHTR